MTTLFITSNLLIDGKGPVNCANGFKSMLLLNTHKKMRCVYVAANPDDPNKNNYRTECYRNSLELIGLTFAKFICLDNRNAHQAAEIISDSNMVIMGGGHVPTQNKFIHKIELPRLIQDFDGVVVGVSAGSLNCAKEVYSIPEHDGESMDPDYKRFFPGLGLTDIQIIPHQNDLRYKILDGKRWYEDIAFADSMGHTFYSMPDGSFYFQKGNIREFHGETWKISDGEMKLMNEQP